MVVPESNNWEWYVVERLALFGSTFWQQLIFENHVQLLGQLLTILDNEKTPLSI